MKASIAAILSFTNNDGILLCNMGEMKKALAEFTSQGDGIYSHQLRLYADMAKPALFQQHPWLETASAMLFTEDNWREQLARVEGLYGDTIELAPITLPLLPIEGGLSEHEKEVVILPPRVR
jgi:hypothetical protein